MSRGALEGERTLSLPIPPLSATRGSSGWEDAGTTGWTGTGDILMFEGYWDSSGYTSDDLTLFPLGITLQDPGRYLSSNANVPLQVLDIVSQTRLDRNDVLTWVTANAMPGMLGTTVEWIQMMWGQYRTMMSQNTFVAPAGPIAEFLTASAALFGSGSPTTVQKIYCYRFLILVGSADGDILAAPASRFVMSAVIAPEDELAFLMRQKRSYELAT